MKKSFNFASRPMDMYGAHAYAQARDIYKQQTPIIDNIK